MSLRALAGWLQPYRWQALASILLLAGTVLASVGLMGTSGALLSRAALRPDVLDLMVLITGVRFFGISRGLLRYAERIVSHDLTFRVLARVRVDFYGRLEPLAPGRLWQARSGDLLARAVQDVDTLQFLYLRAFAPAVAATVIAAATTLWLALVAPAAALVAAVGFLLAGLAVPLLAARLSRGLGAEGVRLRGELSASLLDDASGLAEVLVFGADEARRERLRRLDAALGRVQARLARVNAMASALSGLVANLTLLGVLVVGVPLVRSGALPGFLLASLALAALAAFEGFNPLALAPQTLGASTEAARRLAEATSGQPPAPEPASPLPAPRDLTLRLEAVSLAYEGEEALSGLSLELAPGRRVAVVGASGAGKSTLLNLAARLVDPDDGRVTLGGTDLRDLASADLRKLMAVVSQDAHAFDSTVRENLRLARPGANDDELWQALERARLAARVRAIAGGLDAWVGEGGARLSGGERQRLAIARAFLKNAPILLLDEATANLDARTEAEVFAAAGELMRGRSTLLVTHRLAHALNADEVIVLKAGRVAERGNPRLLAAKDGPFARMLDLERSALSLA